MGILDFIHFGNASTLGNPAFLLPLTSDSGLSLFSVESIVTPRECRPKAHTIVDGGRARSAAPPVAYCQKKVAAKRQPRHPPVSRCASEGEREKLIGPGLRFQRENPFSSPVRGRWPRLLWPRPLASSGTGITRVHMPWTLRNPAEKKPLMLGRHPWSRQRCPLQIAPNRVFEVPALLGHTENRRSLGAWGLPRKLPP